jgi:Zn-dependent peptidase ImmA (M78 family)
MNEDTLIQEQEANCFALFLLMPEPVFSACIGMMPPIDLFAECDGLKKLAEVFGVTENMVLARIHLKIQLESRKGTRP